MEYYQLRAHPRTNVEWRAILLQDEDEKKGIVKSINDRIVIPGSPRINMFLINIETDKPSRKEKPFTTDLIYWQDDLLLKAVVPYNGLIVSLALRHILEEFITGDAVFYEVQLSNVEDTANQQTFYLYHCMTYVQDITDFSNSVYRLTDYNTQSIIREEIGLYNNAADFTKAGAAYFKENKGLLISRRALTADFDIVYGYTNHLIVSENVKRRIELSPIEGVQLPPFRQIISA